ncbi:hypothetical protein CPB97_010433 [Podila verticillata]|nr:hypothetical protein CPB97_010433 [Podila verticillata]
MNRQRRQEAAKERKPATALLQDHRTRWLSTSPRARYPDRFLPPRDPRFRSSPDTLKSSIDHSGASSSISRHFMSNPSSSNSLAHSREFGPTPSYKGSHIDNMNNRSLDYFSSIPTGPGGPGLGLGLGPSRYMDREEWRGRSGQFSRDLERDRDMRGRDGRDPRPRDPRDRTVFNRDERDPREGISTRDFRDRENRDRDARDRNNWSDPKNREGRNSRDGPELDIRELVELEREREKERERDRRERPIWIRESDRDHDGPTHNRSTDAFGRERDRHSIVQELDRDLLAYTSDKPHTNVSSKSDDSISVDDRSEKSRDKDGSARANSDEPPHQPRAMEQERRSFGPNSHRSRSHERSFPTRDDRIYDGEEGRERDYERDYDRDHDRDRNSHIRSDSTNLRSDFDHRSNKGGFGKRQRILSAPMSEDIGYSETFGPRNRDYPSRSSYPASPAASLSHLNRDRLERFDRSDRYSLDESPPTQPRGRRSSDIPEHELYPRAERREHEPRSDRDRPRPREASPLHHTEAPRDRQDPPTEPTVHNPTAPMEPKAMASLPDINKRDRISTPPPLPPPPPPPPPLPPPVVAAPSSQPERMDEDVPIKQEVDSLGPPLETSTLSHDGNSMYAQGTRSTNDKVARSPSTTSLPSPGLSPIREPQVVVPKEAAYENHANILVEIDIVDGDIQKHEEMLRELRMKKEKKLASIAVEEVVVDEAPQTQDMEVEVDQNNATNDIEEPAEAVPVEPAKDQHQLNGLEGEDVEMESVEPETVQVPKFSLQDIMKPVDMDDPFYKRKGQQTRRPQLFDQIYAENNSRAKKYGRVHLAIVPVRNSDQQDEEGRHHHHHHHHHHHRHLNGKPEIFKSVEDYPFYQENIDQHARLRSAMLKNLAAKATALDEKELNLKREYKQHWEVWTKKVEKLDKQKEKMSSTPAPSNTREEDQVGESSVFTTRNRRGAYTSDAVRSEAELLEIIQSLENADMRNPDVRASRTAATVPPMILDPFVREHIHYYDYNHLVTDPAKYYRLGPVTDTWSEEEREIFTKRYLNYPKQFGKIAAGIEGKTASQCVLFYYREKKKIGFKDMLSNRGRKRKNNGGKRKEKAIQPPSPTGQPGKKHKGSALIEDIGQANRTKQAKTKELRELQESNLVLKGFNIEPGSRRRVRSGAQQGGTPGEDTSNAASPAPSSTVSTPVISSADRRKQKPKGNTRGSKTSVAAAAAAAAAVEEVSEKKPKVERSSPAVGGSTTKTTKQEEPLISVDSPGTTPTPSKVISEAEATEVTVTPTSTNAASARWTGPEHEKAIDALKKYGRDFEAVAAAVGTKTVDQCRNFCFNYKRKFGVSALDDANNPRSTPNDDGDLKEGTTAEKSKARKTKAGSASNIVDSSSVVTTGKDTGNAATTGRKRTAKPALPVVPESEKDEPMLDVPESETVEDPDTVPKTRRKRTASRSEAGNADTAPSTGTSFRALYSREPPSISNSPALSSFSPTDSGQFSGSNVDGAAKRPNFSSYWSRQEKLDFVRLLNQYGKDWDQIAKALKTKTQIQVRNHFVNNEGKLVADGVIGIDVVGTSQDQGEPDEQDTSRAPFGGSYAGHEYPPAQYAESMPEQSGGPGPRPGYFMPPSTINGIDTVPVQRETRSMTPPRRATNIGNLLNNNDEDVHVAVEDWFGNSEESGSQDAEDETHEDGGQMPISKPRDVPHDPRLNETRRRDMDEDVETEDEFDRPRAQEMQKTGVRGYPIIGQRRMSEGAPMPHHYPVNPSGPDYYGRHPQTVQHPQGTGVLGSPYGQQYYGPSHAGYGSPPLTVSAPPGNHAYQRMHSPPVPMSTAPSSIIVQPQSHHLSHQHQRSSSTSHGEMIPQSHPSPQMVSRARSPNHQGHYFGQHHYPHPPAPTPPGPYSQHRHSQSGQLEVLSPHPRPAGDTHMMHHSSLPTSSGHVPMGHSGPSRYSSSPQLPGSGSTMRGSPGAGNGSPAHLGHGSSRYSPAPVASPMANEGSMHHLGQQQAYQHHHRRSSSPFQHHVPGHVPSPSYLHAPPHGVHSKPTSALPYSSSHGAASLLPPPLPVSAGPSSSDLSPGPSYHGHRSSQQYSPGYGHHSYQQPPQHHYVEHSGGSMPPSSSAMPHHAQRPHPSGPSYHSSSSGRYTHGSTSS